MAKAIKYDVSGNPIPETNEFGLQSSGASSTVPTVSPNSQGTVALSPAALAGDAVKNTTPQQLSQQSNNAASNMLANPMGGQSFDQYKQSALDKSRNDWAKAFESTRQQYGNVGGSGLLQKNMLQNVLQHNVDEGSQISGLNADYVNNMAKMLSLSQTQQGQNESEKMNAENIFNNRLNAIKSGIASGASSVGDLNAALNAGGIKATQTDLIKDKYNAALQDYQLKHPQFTDPLTGQITKEGIAAYNKFANTAEGTLDTKLEEVPTNSDGTPKYRTGEVFIDAQGNFRQANGDTATPIDSSYIASVVGSPSPQKFAELQSMQKLNPMAFNALVKDVPASNLPWTKGGNANVVQGQIVNLPGIGIAIVTAVNNGKQGGMVNVADLNGKAYAASTGSQLQEMSY